MEWNIMPQLPMHTEREREPTTQPFEKCVFTSQHFNIIKGPRELMGEVTAPRSLHVPLSRASDSLFTLPKRSKHHPIGYTNLAKPIKLKCRGSMPLLWAPTKLGTCPTDRKRVVRRMS